MTAQQTEDWSELAALVRRLQQAAHLPVVRPLGRHYDVVITAAGDTGTRLLSIMDQHPGGCGPVIAEDGRPWMYWVVPPGTREHWDNGYGVCLSAPWRIPIPPTFHEEAQGPYWLRRYRTNRRVGPGYLADALNEVRPELNPHEALAALLSVPGGRGEPLAAADCFAAPGAPKQPSAGRGDS
jgi:hypothetical protein